MNEKIAFPTDVSEENSQITKELKESEEQVLNKKRDEFRKTNKNANGSEKFMSAVEDACRFTN